MSVPTDRQEKRTDKAQYGLAALLAVVGGYVVYDASTLHPGFADQPVEPNAFPYVIGAVLSVGTWYGFYVGLGVPIPAGILDGVL